MGHGQSFHPIPPPSIHPSIHLSLFAFSWVEGAETALGPQTNWPPLGRESCWGSAVSQPCPRRCFCSRIHGVAQSRGQSFHIPPYSTPIHPSIHLFAFIAGSKVLKRPLVRKPMGHPLGLNPAGVLLLSNRALGGVSAAESMLLHIQVAQCFLWRFRRCSFGSWIHSAAQGRYTSTHQPITSTHQPIQGQSFHHHPPIHLFAFSWFEGAETAPGPQTNGPPLGPESCWGSAVSQPCPIRCSRIHGAAQGHGQSFHPIPPPSIHPSIHLSLLLAGSKVLKRPLVRKPMGHPFCWGSAVSQPCPRRCFCSRIQGAAQGHGQSFHPIPYPSIHPSISLCF